MNTNSVPSSETNGEVRCDVVIIGAGPAGCATATILAQNGHDVLLVEKQQFPRYRVGESLIPYCWFPLNRIGVIEKMNEAAFATQKRSVQFVSTDGAAATAFPFSEHTEHECALTWQVHRDAFDQMLLDNALQHGARVLMQTNARQLIRDASRVVGIEATDASGASVRIIARTVVDASGRDMFAVTKNDWRVPDPDLHKIAMWSYYKGARRDCGQDATSTTIAYLPDKGWFWYIPLPDDIVSVGVVAEREYLYRGPRDPQAIMDREIDIQPWVRERVIGSTCLVPPRVTGDYSYRSRHCAEDGLILVGDAFAFLDPVFSSGVYLALQSGVMAGDTINAALAVDDTSAARFGEYSERLRTSIEAMRKLVYAFYDTAFRFSDLVKAHPDLRHDLTDCLIGNLERDFTALNRGLAEFANIPQPAAHGGPLLTQPTDV